MDPNAIDCYRSRSTAYLYSGLLNRSLAYFNKLIQIAPIFFDFFNHSKTFYPKKQLDQAISDSSEVVQLEPDFAEGYLHLSLH